MSDQPDTAMKMPSDMGIVILETSGPKFRVAYFNPESLFGNWVVLPDGKETWSINQRALSDFLSKDESKNVFTQLDDAINFAKTVLESKHKNEYLEWGIVRIDMWKDLNLED
jgi:hypothetical protein